MIITGNCSIECIFRVNTDVFFDKKKKIPLHQAPVMTISLIFTLKTDPASLETF